MNFSISTPRKFKLSSTIYSHGWSSLPPFRVNKEKMALQLTLGVSSGKHAILEIEQKSSSLLSITAQPSAALSQVDKRELVSLVRSSLRMDEDYSEFYREARRHFHYRWIPRTGAGRLLRSPTVFEDVVKMICTTNCSWALTEIMINNLCNKLGAETAAGTHMFPAPEAIANSTERFLRKEIRAGYRAPYLLEMSKKIAAKKIDPESWRESTASTPELFEEVRSFKGVGPYAAGNILKLLGRYDYLGIDSWCRKKFAELQKNGRKKSDAYIEKSYLPFGRWRGLFFWMDMTKDWYDKRNPF